MEIVSKWDKFIKEVGNLIFFWLVGIVFFAIHRSIFIILYSEELSKEVKFIDFCKAYYMGFRFDCTAVAYFVIAPLIFTLLLAPFGHFKLIKRIRIVFQYLFVILSSIICMITLNYYKEYNDQFNMFLFLGMYDDQSAIIKTIIEYYHPILNTLAVIAVSTIALLLFRCSASKSRISNLIYRIRGKVGRTIFVALIIFLTIASLRGTFHGRPVTRNQASITMDKLLNRTVLNPYRAFIYALDEFKKLNQLDGDNPYGKIDSSLMDATITSIMKKQSKGTDKEKPKQIFLIIMESYCSWPLLDEYAPLGVANNLREIAKEGTSFFNFLPAHNATIYAYTTTITGMPYTGINISRLATNQAPYISSIFSQFKKLGYKTNTFYGGGFAWENIGVLTEHLQCDNVYSLYEDYEDKATSVWGLDDAEMFDVVLEKLDPEEYTFNLILTLSNHPPYLADIYGKGYMYNEAKDLPDEARKLYGRGMNLLELGHIWYGDWAIGRFMDVAKTKYPDALFAFTGDHYGRRFINATPNLYETSSVPFILYGKDIPAQKLNTPGSHMDIMPTLIELVAPKDFTYYSFGESMFDSDKKMGIGLEKIVDRDSLYYMPREGSIASINLKDHKEVELQNMKYQKEYSDIMKLAWYYVVHGDTIHLKQTKK